MYIQRITFTGLLFGIFLLIQVSVGHAATVRAVKGKRVLVQVQPDEVKKNEVYYVTRDGKRVGIVKIRAVKGGKAMAQLGKGAAAKGDTLVLRGAKAVAPTEAAPAAEAESDSGATGVALLKERGSWGIVAGLAQSSATVDLRNSSGVSLGNVDLSGSGFNLKGLFDYPLFAPIWFRAMAGVEQFVAGGTNNSNCGAECTIDITYLTADFWGRFVFGSKHRWWLGAGFDLLFPLSKSSTALDESSITNTSILAVGGGVDFVLQSGSYIPLQIEYGMYPESDQVEASAIMVRVGYGKRF